MTTLLAISRGTRRGDGQRGGLVGVPHRCRSWMRCVLGCGRRQRRRRCRTRRKAQAWICRALLGRPSTLRCCRHGRVAVAGLNVHKVDERGIAHRSTRCWWHGRGWPAEWPIQQRKHDVRNLIINVAIERCIIFCVVITILFVPCVMKLEMIR